MDSNETTPENNTQQDYIIDASSVAPQQPQQSRVSIKAVLAAIAILVMFGLVITKMLS